MNIHDRREEVLREPFPSQQLLSSLKFNIADTNAVAMWFNFDEAAFYSAAPSQGITNGLLRARVS